MLAKSNKNSPKAAFPASYTLPCTYTSIESATKTIIVWDDGAASGVVETPIPTDSGQNVQDVI